MNLSTVFTKQHVSIFLIWLFHVSGILGIIYSNASWFVRATPLNLLLSFGLLLINLKRDQKALGLLFLCFVVGMAAEILGVRYGLIFGEYSYGAVLGPKVF